MPWWLWMLLGLGLLGLEAMTPGGFFVLFFGLGALIVGILAATGIVASAPLQWLLFSVTSVASLVLFRKRLLSQFGTGPARPVDALVGEIGVLVDEIAAHGIGRCELRGTVWTARNLADRTVAGGTRVRVERVDGLTVAVRPE